MKDVAIRTLGGRGPISWSRRLGMVRNSRGLRAYRLGDLAGLTGWVELVRPNATPSGSPPPRTSAPAITIDAPWRGIAGANTAALIRDHGRPYNGARRPRRRLRVAPRTHRPPWRHLAAPTTRHRLPIVAPMPQGGRTTPITGRQLGRLPSRLWATSRLPHCKIGRRRLAPRRDATRSHAPQSAVACCPYSGSEDDRCDGGSSSRGWATGTTAGPAGDRLRPRRVGSG